MIRLFIVDDHKIMRDGLRAILRDNSDLMIVGEAANGQELLDKLPTTPTDVVLLDMHMPVLDGLATTTELRKHFPGVRVLMLSMLEQERTIGQVLDAGADGYVLKNSDRTELVAAVHTVAMGKQFLCSALGLSMLRKVLAIADNTPDTEQGTACNLSVREREILQLIATGLTNQEIADKIFSSKRTIETHRQNIIEKTNAKNTAALIKYAMQTGLVK